MSLTKANLPEIVKKQYFYKLRAYVPFLMTLLVLQVLAIAFSFNGVGGSGSRMDSLEIDAAYYSSDIIVGFTLLWGVIAAIQITMKTYRYDDFTFVTNRLSSNLSNALFLLTASIIGGLTAMLSSYFFKVVIYFFANNMPIKSTDTVASPSAFLLGIMATILYVFLFCALGYFVGTLVQMYKIFAVLLPVLFIGVSFLGGLNGNSNTVWELTGFFFKETSFVLFILKATVTISLLFACSFLLANRLEVRQ